MINKLLLKVCGVKLMKRITAGWYKNDILDVGKNSLPGSDGNMLATKYTKNHEEHEA
jgi:hypothetical protein